MPLDVSYVNTYKGGDFPNDKSDKSNGSIGNHLFILVEYNTFITIYFGDYGFREKQQKNLTCVDYYEIAELYKLIGTNMSKINIDDINTTLNNLKSKMYRSNIIIKFNNVKYYYHEHFMGMDEILIECGNYRNIIAIFDMSMEDQTKIIKMIDQKR